MLLFELSPFCSLTLRCFCIDIVRSNGSDIYWSKNRKCYLENRGAGHWDREEEDVVMVPATRRAAVHRRYDAKFDET
ncbi:hypothetical protein AVEN_228750-1 [Araneus ventricosus]|uniref:Uncharacterized protein n=1 Tax=Araneus ventricosus TaxID=182803 RepID=A0A4Y2GMP7_ARAVE|nr:hypothetical protein AVEN_228750-1 [Araneus ventricosus]